jgi:branched-chain amino acid transport system permease protein
MLNLIFAGFVSGSIYALMAVGVIVVYRASRVLNFAHGEFAGFAAFLALSLYVNNDVPLLATFAIILVASIALALVVETTLAYPMRNAPVLEVVAITLGVSLILAGLLLKFFGTDVKLFPRYVEGTAFKLGDASMTLQNVTTIVATLVVLGAVAALFQFTRLGVAMRAASENGRLATLLGINPKTVSLTSWAIAGALAAVAAMLVAPDLSLSPDAFTILLVQSFAALVLGGFTSLLGAVVGGYILGISLNLFSYYVASDMPATFILVAVLAILLVRPHGLFGKEESVRL